MSVIDSQPRETTAPEVAAPSKFAGVKNTLGLIKDKVTTKEGWIGDYDYGWSVLSLPFHASHSPVSRLCTPTLPFFGRKASLPPFYGLNDELPLLLAITSGLQHALAMLGGLITPPIILASSLNLDDETSAYMISASLIGCGMLS